MKIFTKQDDWLVNEGKNSPVKVGDIVRITNKFAAQYENTVFQFESYRSWEKAVVLNGSRWGSATKKNLDYRAALESNDEITIMYMYVKKSGMKWAEGIPVLVGSDFYDLIESYKQVRFDFKQCKNIPSPGKETEILNKDCRTYPNLLMLNLGGASKFLKGNEDYVLNSKGESIGKFTSGNYDYEGVSYKLSEKFNTTVLRILEESKVPDKTPEDEFYYMTVENFFSTKNELSNEVLETVASKISKIIGVEVRVKNGDFSIPWFSVKSGNPTDEDSNNPFAKKTYTAEPFFTYEQADEHIANLKEINKKNRLSFDIKTLRIERCSEHQNFNLSFSQLVEYASTFGLNFDFDEFVEKNKGGISAKKFGF